MNVILSQVEGQPAGVTVCNTHTVAAEHAPVITPTGVPFWIVSQAEIDEMYEQFGAYRNAWRITAESIGRQPDGYGA